MAIKVSGTSVINDSRQLQNIASLDSTTISTIGANIQSGAETGSGVPSVSGASNGELYVDTNTNGGFYFFGDTVWNEVQFIKGLKPNTASGSATFTTAATHTWTVPSGVNHVSVVLVGGGGSGSGYGSGGGGGGLIWKNNLVTNAGDQYTIIIGTPPGGNTNGVDTVLQLNGQTLIIAEGGGRGYSNSGGGVGGGSSITARIATDYGGGTGGVGGDAYGPNYVAGGGGGAAGYSGNGGNGAGQNSGGGGINGTSGSGGGGGGGGGIRQSAGYSRAASGGGVGLLGQGSNGSGQSFTITESTSHRSNGGGGGSGGSTPGTAGWSGGAPGGGDYGGGGGNYAGGGGIGAARIVYKTGAVGSFAFPSTNIG